MHPVLKEVYLVPAGIRFLLHAPLHGVTSLVNGRVAQELRMLIGGCSPSELSNAVRPLAKALLETDPLLLPRRQGPFAPTQVSILPTNDCNMRCLYCAPGAGSNDCTYMREEICDAALRYQAEVVRRENFDSLTVYYFGGEPFVAWSLIQFCDTRARELADSLGVRFISSCTTNAFLSESHAKWVGEHLTFALVSLDGPAEMHDHYRPTAKGGATHEVVVRSLKIFQDCGMPYALRCSVDDQTVKRLPEIVDYFCREFAPVKINLEPLIEHGRCLETGLRSPDPREFVRAIIESGRVARGFGVELKLTTAQIDRIAESNCPVAEDNFVVTPDGLVSSCYGANHRNSENAPEYGIGEVTGNPPRVEIDQEKVEKTRTFSVSNIPRCAGCFAKWHCSGGCRLFHTTAFCEEPINDMCLVTQRLTLWNILRHLQLDEEADRVGLEEELVCS